MPFKALGLRPEILEAIKDVGYSEPTPIQIRAVPPILKGRDLIGIAQTGTGKTAAFTWPILERLSQQESTTREGRRVPRVLVLAPTRELSVQVFDNMKSYGRHLPLRYASVYGGVSEVPQIRALREGVDVIVATPGRLLDLMSTLQAPVRDVQILVLDEADRMLDMGFIPDIRRIVRALPFDRQTLLFSATFSPEIEMISREFLKNPETVEVGRRATPTETVSQFVYEVPRQEKGSLLVHLLHDAGLDSVLVFTRTKHGAEKLSQRLMKEGIATAALHSNRSQSQRMAALKGFKAGQFRVLVATDIAARGIDVDGISHVVNFDFPAHPEDYVHRIGRTGRAQAIGDALSFVTPDDQKSLKALERFIGRGIPRRRVLDLPVEASELRERPRRGERDRPPQGSKPRDRRRRPGGEGGGGARRRERGSPAGSTPASAGRPRQPAAPPAQPALSGGRDRPGPEISSAEQQWGRPGKAGRARRGRR